MPEPVLSSPEADPLGALGAAVLLAGSLQALALAAWLLAQRRWRHLATSFLALVLLALALRMGKSSLNTWWVLEPWTRNLGLAGMLAVGPALFGHWAALAPRPDRLRLAAAAAGLALAVLFGLLAPWVPNAAGDPVARATYTAILVLGASYLGIGVMDAQYAPAERRRWVYASAAAVGSLWLGFALVFATRSLSGYFALCIAFALAATALMFGWPLLSERYGRLLRQTAQVVDTETAAQDLLATLARPEVFRDPDLSLERFARQRSLPPKFVSEVLNLAEPMSFRRRLNLLRIAEAKRLLAAGWLTTRSLTDLAMEVGYNSPTQFGRVFRELEGCAPSEWRAS